MYKESKPKKMKLVIALFMFLSVRALAEDQYHGVIEGKIVEKNSDLYTALSQYGDKEWFKGNDVLYFRQDSGQTVALFDQDGVVFGSANNKYHMIFEIYERKGDKFKASVKVFQNRFKVAEGNVTTLSTKEIAEKYIEGDLNSDNAYTFIDDGKPNLYINVSIDRLFSEEEIKARMYKELQ